MKIFAVTFMLLFLTSIALHASDPNTFCETKTATLAVSSFKHCQKGDLLKVDAYDMQQVCDTEKTIVPIQNEYLCVYRGSKRSTRNRPLTKTEKLLQQESIDNLVDKYTD